MLVRIVPLIILLLWPLAVRAELYTVTGVRVDKTAASAAQAREQALAEGQRAALERLLKRLTLREQHDKLPVLTERAIREMVSSVNIESEQTSGVRYIGSLAVSFEPQRIRTLLRQKNMSYAETRSRPLLVLPLWQEGTTKTLWGDANPWLVAWQQYGTVSALTPFYVPLGDASDIVILRMADLESGNVEAVLKLAEKYNAPEVIVVTALQRAGDAPTLTINIERISRQQRLAPQALTVQGVVGDTLSDLLNKGVKDVAETVEEAWKKRNLVRPDAVGVVNISAPIQTVRDWALLAQRLRQVSLVQVVRPTYIDLQEVRAQIEFAGHIEQFQVAVEQHGLILREQPPYWVLQTDVNFQKER